MADDSGRFHFNGVNGATGEYGLPAMTGEELARVVEGETDEGFFKELETRQKVRKVDEGKGHLDVKEGVAPEKLEEAGWGVVFAHDADPAVQEALSPLLKLRREQAGEHFRLYEKAQGFRVGRDDKNSFLARHGAGPGPADPDKVPYYLLIVGSPEKIPFRFQTQLDVQYAVGRIDFGDDMNAYASYAQSVVAAETGQVALPRRLSFWSVRNDDDEATRQSSEELVQPLAAYTEKKHPDWTSEVWQGDQAKKAGLARLLGGEETPALLFTASHGMEFPSGDERQVPHQGALLGQDWPGPRAWRGQGAVPQDYYFAGEDLPSSAKLLGLVGFFFACYGGGTPRLDEFSKQAFKETREVIAPQAFLAGLPARMLAQPGGGALAVVGHVERAWGCSFVWPDAGPQTTVFESALDVLMAGNPVGMAVEYFNSRYAELSVMLSGLLDDLDFGKDVDPYLLANRWTANNDARGYTVIGDPAVRLPVAATGSKPTDRPVLEVAATAVPSAPAPSAAPEKLPELLAEVRRLAARTAEAGAGIEAATDPAAAAEEARKARADLLAATRCLDEVLELLGEPPDAV